MISTDCAPSPEGDGSVDFAGDIDVAVDTLLDCVDERRGSPEFGWLAGLTLGRLTAMDLARDDGARQEQLAALCRVVGEWTLVEPEFFLWLLSSCDPARLYSLILFWPPGARRLRVFLIGCLMGLAVERAEGTAFLGDCQERASLLVDILEESWAGCE